MQTTLTVNSAMSVRGLVSKRLTTRRVKCNVYVPPHVVDYSVSFSHPVEELRQVKPPSSTILSQLGVDDMCPVTQVSKNSPADHADISTGDIIEEVRSLDSNVYELIVVHPDGSTTVEYLVMPVQ